MLRSAAGCRTSSQPQVTLEQYSPEVCKGICPAALGVGTGAAGRCPPSRLKKLVLLLQGSWHAPALLLHSQPVKGPLLLML
jgi:hypothetical protein